MSAINASARGRTGLAQRFARLATIFQFDGARAGGAERVVAEAPLRGEALLRRHLRTLGAGAVAVEIGHRGAGHADWLPDGIEHRMVTLAGEDRPTDVIEALRAMPSCSVDAVFSVDAIECLRTPWRVADEIARVLKPGGVTFHSSVFTTRYQPRPEDFFRFTPDGLRALFADFECLTAEFDATESRRARPASARRERGDIFGGTREGWRVHFAGRKTALR